MKKVFFCLGLILMAGLNYKIFKKCFSPKLTANKPRPSSSSSIPKALETHEDEPSTLEKFFLFTYK